MQIYCKIVDGAIVARERKDSPEVATGPDGNPVWRPFVANAPPSFDSQTHHAPVRTEDIQPSQVVETWAAPVAKTAQEIDADNEAITATMDTDRYLRAFALVVLDEVNLLRAEHAMAPRTATQLRAAVKAKL